MKKTNKSIISTEEYHRMFKELSGKNKDVKLLTRLINKATIGTESDAVSDFLQAELNEIIENNIRGRRIWNERNDLFTMLMNYVAANNDGVMINRVGCTTFEFPTEYGVMKVQVSGGNETTLEKKMRYADNKRRRMNKE